METTHGSLQDSLLPGDLLARRLCLRDAIRAVFAGENAAAEDALDRAERLGEAARERRRL
jgi:hypothetical protein